MPIFNIDIVDDHGRTRYLLVFAENRTQAFGQIVEGLSQDNKETNFVGLRAIIRVAEYPDGTVIAHNAEIGVFYDPTRPSQF